MNTKLENEQELVHELLFKYAKILKASMFNSKINDGEMEKMRSIAKKLKDFDTYDFKVSGSNEELMESIKEFTRKFMN